MGADSIVRRIPYLDLVLVKAAYDKDTVLQKDIHHSVQFRNIQGIRREGHTAAITDKKLSSAVGFKGIFRKVLIFLLVGIANVIDVEVIGTGAVLRTAVIFFYISNEGVSLLENAGHLGLPVPEKIRSVLEQLHDRAEKEEE